MFKQSRPALLLVDLQKGLDELAFYGGRRNNPMAEQNAGLLLQAWRQKKWPVFHVKHNSTNPDSPLAQAQAGNAIKEEVFPLGEEPVIEKNVNSAFIGTDLQQRLDAASIKQLVVVGLTTDHCVSTTVRMAANLNYETYLVADATATFDKIGPNGKKYAAELIHETTLASLHKEFAVIVQTAVVLASLNASG